MNDTGDEEARERGEGGEGPVPEKKLGKTVKVLGLISLFTDASSEMIYPLLPIFLSSVLGVGTAFIGVIEGVAEGTASVLKGFSGYISDRLHKRKALILAGYGLSALTKPFFAAADAAWQVLLVRFTDRVGKGIRTAPRDAMIAESTDRAIWGKAYGFHRAMDTMGAIVGPGLAFLLMWALSGQGDERYRWVFLAAFIPGLVAVCLILFVLKEEPFKSATKFPGLRLAGFGRSYKMLLLVVAVFTLGNSSDAFLLLKAQDVFEQAGISGLMIPVLIPLIWLTFNVVYSAVSMPAGILSDRIGRKETLLNRVFPLRPDLSGVCLCGVYHGGVAPDGRLRGLLRVDRGSDEGVYRRSLSGGDEGHRVRRLSCHRRYLEAPRQHCIRGTVATLRGRHRVPVRGRTGGCRRLLTVEFLRGARRRYPPASHLTI